MFGVGYLINIHDMGDVVDVGKLNHADIVLLNPDYFGLTNKEFEYFKYHDDENHEKLFNRIFQDGWVRIRIFRNSISFEYANISDDLISDLITHMNLSGNFSILLEDINFGYLDIPSYSYFLSNNSDVALCRQKIKNPSIISQFREQYANIVNKLIKLSFRDFDF